MLKKVLILEDNLQTANVIEDILQQLDFSVNVFKTASVETAYKYAFEKSIDAFIIDIILDTSRPGDTSGMRFAQRIRELPKYYFTPIIFITALYDPELHAYRDIHCFGYIEKPFSEKKVIDLLSQALNFTTERNDTEIIYLRKDGILYSVKIDDIIYVQVQHHWMHITLHKDVLEIPYKTIKSLLSETNSNNLVQCNKYTLVNKKSIQSIDITNGYIKMLNRNELISIGIRYCKFRVS